MLVCQPLIVSSNFTYERVGACTAWAFSVMLAQAPVRNNKKGGDINE